MMKRLQSSLKLTLPPHESPGWESKEKCSPLSLKSSNQQLPHKHEPFCCSWDMLAGAIPVQWAGRRLQSLLAAGVQHSPGPQYPSCSSGHASPPLQMLFLQQPPWHPVFWCPLPCKKQDPRCLQALQRWQKLFQGTPLLHQDSLGIAQMSLSSLFLLAYTGGLFSVFRAAKKLQVTLHRHILHPSGWSQHGASVWAPESQRGWMLRWEDFPSWTSATALQVLQQTTDLSGLHEEAFEHSRFGGEMAWLTWKERSQRDLSTYSSSGMLVTFSSIGARATKWKKQIFARMKMSSTWWLSFCLVFLFMVASTS